MEIFKKIFEKKLDIQKDHLRIIFNPTERKYQCYYGNTPIPYDNLIRKSKKQ